MKMQQNNIRGKYSSKKYSSVCDAFDEFGIGIFGESFIDIYDKKEI